jgi:hypothetical protein
MRYFVGFALCVLFCQVGFAAPACVLDPDFPITSYATLVALGPDGCSQGDKIYSGFSVSGKPAGTISAFSILDETGPIDVHGWTFGGTFGVGTYDIRYTITIDPLLAPTFVLQTAQLDAQATSAVYTVTKTLNPGPGQLVLSVTQATVSDFEFLAGGPISLVVADHVVVTSGTLTGITNTFTQVDTNVVVPEPVTMALFGSGLLLLGFARRFRRQ